MNQPTMSNLDVTLAGFWQLARHWKQGHKAKLELACENGNLHMNLSAYLGHPDLPHFPKPPPPNPSTNLPPPEKRKSPSYVRRQERRRQKAKEASHSEDTSSTNSEKEITVESLKEPILGQKSAEKPADVFIEKPTEQFVEESIDLSFKCDQCEYTNATEKGLGQHKRMKHRISQIDGMDEYFEEVAEKAHIGFMEEDSINSVSVKYKISVKEKKSVKEVETI